MITTGAASARRVAVKTMLAVAIPSAITLTTAVPQSPSFQR